MQHARRVGLQQPIPRLQVRRTNGDGAAPGARVGDDLFLRVALDRDLVARELDPLEAARDERGRNDQAYRKREAERQESARGLAGLSAAGTVLKCHGLHCPEMH